MSWKSLRWQWQKKSIREKFFDEVAKEAWKYQEVSGLLKKYETTTTMGWDINDASRFSKVLQGVYDDPTGKTTVLSAVAKIIHDDLNKSGVEVSNWKGDGPWTLSGDGTLNEETLEVGKKAVAQSRSNILRVVSKKGNLDEAKLYKAVWDYVPRPTAKGTKLMASVIEALTNPSQTKTISDAAEIIKNQVGVIVDELVKRKNLQDKGWW